MCACCCAKNGTPNDCYFYFAKIKIQIRNIVHDSLTVAALNKAKPKSRKMKIMILPYKWKSLSGIYYMTLIIHEISVKNPALFHRLKQTR